MGKTSIITRFMYDKFDNTYQASHSNSITTCKQCLVDLSPNLLHCRQPLALTSCPRPCTLKTELSGCSSGENDYGAPALHMHPLSLLAAA